jgi:Ca2+-transporting ATPase
LAEDTRWHTEDPAAVLAVLGSHQDSGLTQQEAAARLADHGPNTLRGKPPTPAWRRFLAQFNDFMIYVLLAAVVISAAQGDALEAIAILVIVLTNGVLGFVQESKAEQALARLKEMTAPTALVLRDGEERTVPASELVVGDVIVLEAGAAVPADARLIEAAALRMEEAALTGESVPVSKTTALLEDPDAALGDRRNLVFASTHVAAGRGRAVVVATGMATEVGKIAELLEAPQEKTPLERELHVVGRRIALACLAISAVVFAAGLAKGNPPAAMFLVAVSLAVAAIPEGLPAVVTVALALAVQRMAARNAIVRRLHAVETLGSCDTICTDKTGTLTVNEMTVTSVAAADHSWAPDLVSVGGGAELEWLRLVARHCNDAREAQDRYLGDPTEVALLKFASDAPDAERLDEVPFDSERKRMTTVVRLADGRVVSMTKGAPDILLTRSSRYLTGDSEMPLDDSARARITHEAEVMASKGRRTLGACYRLLDEACVPDSGATASAPPGTSAYDTSTCEPESLERDMVFVGLYALSDPPRPEVPGAIELCRSAGIRVVMVTGDHRLTAEAIAREIGLAPDEGAAPGPAGDAPVAMPAADDLVPPEHTDWSISGPELDHLAEDEFVARARDLSIYARVSPSHKLRIVDALRGDGHIVAMTGDGVNDAPALKRADIGVAMGRVGTDVTREAADMVLADDNFATIVAAVREGRAVFDNIRKVILFLLSCNVSEVLIVFTSIFFLAEPALLPLQILWINLVTDGFPALALGVDPASRNIMQRRPRGTREGILVPRRQLQIVVQGSLITAGGLTALAVAMALGDPLPEARSILFTTMVLTQLLYSLTFRSERVPVFSANTLRNKWLLAALAGSLALHVGLIYLAPVARIFGVVPLGPTDWLIVLACSLVPLALIDATKRALTMAPAPVS